ncbi:MAG: head-tail adaptor protein [Alphaproteobacteria bacterium]
MAKRPTAGELRHRVAFDKREEVNPDAPNDYGNTTDEFVEQFRCRASFEHGGGSEAVMASRLEGRNTFRVSIRSSEASRQIGSDWRMRDVRTGFE